MLSFAQSPSSHCFPRRCSFLLAGSSCVLHVHPVTISPSLHLHGIALIFRGSRALPTQRLALLYGLLTRSNDVLPMFVRIALYICNSTYHAIEKIRPLLVLILQGHIGASALGV